MTGLLFAHEQALTPRDNYLLTFPRNLSTGITARRSFEYMTEPVGAAVLSSPSPLRAESAELLRISEGGKNRLKEHTPYSCTTCRSPLTDSAP